ncbi:hypothetical protein ACFVZ3_21940 [Kitasatospora purpeofusca]|uniref:hypothetical protein n=1 Tax=Kitasatospora purpeofusca TaxID=67352 RepID=UPI00369CF8C0
MWGAAGGGRGGGGGWGARAGGAAAAYASNSSIAGVPLDAGTYGIGGVSALTSLRPAGHLVTTTSGTLRLRWAQHNAHSTPTTLYPPSWIRLKRIA